MNKVELIKYLENNYKVFLVDKVKDCYKKEIEISFDKIIELIKNSKNDK